MNENNNSNEFFILSDNPVLIYEISEILERNEELNLSHVKESKNDNFEIANCKYYFKMCRWKEKQPIIKLAPDGRNTKELHNDKNEIVDNGDIID